MYNNNGNYRRNNDGKILKLAGEKKKRDGSTVPNVYKTYIEVGSKLIAVEISPANKETKDGRPAVWVAFTHAQKPTARRRSL